MIAGLDDPGDPDSNDAAPTVDVIGTSDTTPTNDANGDDGGKDADAGRRCTGTVLKTDSFDDRTDDAAGGWGRNYAGEGGVIEIKNGELHIDVPPSNSGVNLRRQLDVTKDAPQRMCVSFKVRIVKPQNTGAFFDGGDMNFGFIGVVGTVNDAEATYYEGISIIPSGPIAYVYRGASSFEDKPLAVPITSPWNVYLSVDLVADKLTIAVNDAEATFTNVRPTAPPSSATLTLGIRNLGLVPEAEAFYDDVVVTAD
jgi:hypothetical protein